LIGADRQAQPAVADHELGDDQSVEPRLALRRELQQLKLERDILSKAAWFARETNAIPPTGSVS